MRAHTLIGERIIATAPSLTQAAWLVRSSHERYDGGGYPHGIAGEEIPLGARIIFACDAYDAMTSDRSYRAALSEAEARERTEALRRHAVRSSGRARDAQRLPGRSLVDGASAGTRVGASGALTGSDRVTLVARSARRSHNPGPYTQQTSTRSRSVQEMVIYGVSFDMVGKQPIVLLKAVESNKFLPIWIGHPEAAAILMKLQGATTPRPMTHDLLSDVLGELEVECTRVSVTELRDNTFYASISLRSGARELEIDSRPSDALALAVRSGAPIFAADEVITESAIEFEHEVEDTEEVVEKFKDFLDQVTPEDFASDE